MLLKKVMALVTTFTFTISTYAINMQGLFDSVNIQDDVSNPIMLQGQTVNLYAGDSPFTRVPKHTYQLATVTPPSWNAGCGGIDLFTGDFSLINREQSAAVLCNIGSNTLDYGFKLAIQDPCLTCDNVMQTL